jgi:hypothetical protein
MLALEDIIKASLSHTASTYGTRLLRYATHDWNSIGQTPIDSHPAMTAKIKSFDYVGEPAPSIDAVLVYSDVFVNDTDQEQKTSFKYNEEREQSLSWSVAERVSFGMEISAKAGVPDAAEVQETFIFKFGLSATQAGQSVEKKTWSKQLDAVAKPRSTLACYLHLRVESFTSEFISEVELRGCVAAEFSAPIDLGGGFGSHRIWYLPLWGIFYGLIYNKGAVASTKGYRLFKDPGDANPFSGVIATTHGSVSGSHGIKLDPYVGPPKERLALHGPSPAPV